MTPDDRPVWRWAVVSPTGLTVAELPVRLAPTQDEAEAWLRRTMGDIWRDGWHVVPRYHATRRD